MEALWVFEAEDDKHLVGQLARALNIGDLPGDVKVMGGNDTSTIALQLRQDWKRIVFVLDADRGPRGGAAHTWRRLRSAFDERGFPLPEQLPPSGLVHPLTEGRSVAVWIFPDNVNDGAMEEFVTGSLVAHDDPLLREARDVVFRLEGNRDARPLREPAARFPVGSREKAVVRTWLAWQKRPGAPPGVAVKEKYLSVDPARLADFAAWLRRAVGAEAAPGEAPSGSNTRQA